MGWNYAMSWLVILPFELIAAGVTISFWTGNDVDESVSITPAAWITIFLVLIIVINVFGVRGYGEVEFILGAIKVTAVIGFIILGIVINTGGVPTDGRGYIGGTFWRAPPTDDPRYPPFPANPDADPPTPETPRNWAAFKNGFKGWCSVFVTAAFAFAGTELVGLAAAEADNPRKSLPTATKQVFWRIAIFYIVSLLILGLIVPSDDPTLKRASGANSKYSPMVRACTLANIKVLPHIFNAVITLSVISVANSCTYGSTRTIQALALNGMAPKIFTRVDKHGRPYVALAIALIFGLLAYVALAPKGGVAFDWLLSLSALSSLFTWGSINLAHICYRRAWKHAGRDLDELPFKAMFGVAGSYVGLGLNIIALIATFYVSLYPVGGPDLDVEAFFIGYLAAPIVLVFFFGHKIYVFATTRSLKWGVNLRTIDVDEGRRELNLREEMDAERAANRALPFWKKCLKFWF
jgi:amino acid transporter